MSKLDELGGTKRAAELANCMGGEEAEMMEALIERVEELERELATEVQEGRELYRATEFERRQLESELKPLRELAEMVLKDAGSLECVAPGLALVAKARECLNEVDK